MKINPVQIVLKHLHYSPLNNPELIIFPPNHPKTIQPRFFEALIHISLHLWWIQKRGETTHPSCCSCCTTAGVGAATGGVPGTGGAGTPGTAGTGSGGATGRAGRGGATTCGELGARKKWLEHLGKSMRIHYEFNDWRFAGKIIAGWCYNCCRMRGMLFLRVCVCGKPWNKG